MSTCVFCSIVDGHAPANVVREWDDAIAIVPLNPVIDGHVLVLPRQHVEHFTENPDVTAAVARRAAELGGDMLENLGDTDEPAANLITSQGRAATQTVPHLHLHIVTRFANDGLPLPWTPQQEALQAGREWIPPTRKQAP